jgi:hypothetical protein
MPSNTWLHPAGPGRIKAAELPWHVRDELLRYVVGMRDPLTAQEVWPLVEKLPHDELVRLAKLALHAAAPGRTAPAAYRAQPPDAEEFGTDEEPLAWEGEGWER